MRKLCEIDDDLKIYIGITVGSGEMRHMKRDGLPIGVITQDVAVFANKKDSLTADKELTQFAANCPSIGMGRTINVNEGGQTSGAPESSPHVLYIGVKPAYIPLAEESNRSTLRKIYNSKKNSKGINRHS